MFNKPLKNKPSSDSSSEMSLENNSEQESNSFIIQRKKKNKRAVSKQLQFTEASPDMRFSRQDEKKYIEKHLVGYVGLDHDRGCDVIWNVVNVSMLVHFKKEKLYQELLKLKELKHENINTISEVWKKDDENSIIFITDSFFGGSIRQYLYKIGIQKLKVIKSWIKMILLGLEYLHKNGYVFRDLNCGRIYYNNNNGVVSIGDLYVSSPVFYQCFNENEYESFPPNCMSPEIINNQQVSAKSDIYSLGMVLIEMITIEIPYSDPDLFDSSIMQKIKDGVKPSILDRISDEGVKQFIMKLINSDINKRPSLQELYNEDFLKIDDKEDNRKIKLIKIKKKKKKKKQKQSYDVDPKHKKPIETRKSLLPFKKHFEEIPYKDSLKMENLTNSIVEEVNPFSNGKNKIRNSLKSNDKDSLCQRKNEKILDNSKKESVTYVNHVVTSSHEGGTHYSKYNSDVYHTGTTDFYGKPTKLKNNSFLKANNMILPKNSYGVNNNNLVKTNTDESLDKCRRHNNDQNIRELVNNTNGLDNMLNNYSITNKNKQQNGDDNYNSPPYQIFDASYNVHLKFLINQDGKLHEIQFTYNLLKDSIPELMEEIQNEFNFSHDNLNLIYETLKKISIYSKFYKKSDILHDNSV